jgi:16S rRNA (guanine527-N7)-methyltransferase
MRGKQSDPRLQAYESLLRAWAPRLDLFSPRDLSRLRERHIDDSLRALPIVADRAGPCVDVGSGAGLPGIPLAICAPHLFWHLLEPRKKRAAFLEEAIRELELANCEVVVRTAEQAASDPALAAAHDVAMARALAPPLEAFRAIAPLVRDGGIAVIFLGERGEIPPGAEGEPGGLAIMRKSAQPS